MPQFNRRGFLQLVSATAAAPLLPALPARAATVAASPSKALWAGMYARAGSGAQFVKTAQGLGLSSGAIQGVGARSIGVRIVVAAAQPVATEVARKAAAPASRTSLSQRLKLSRKAMRKLEDRVLAGVEDVMLESKPEPEISPE